MCIRDRHGIITRAEIHKQQIVETKTPIEYSLRDLYRNLKGQQVKINLWVEVMPIVGYIYRDKVASFNYTLPNEYVNEKYKCCLLYTSPSPRDRQKSRMPSSA
eukprot:TRINITY_DN6263_c0_g1_i3.p5 TRINITY_DN6263_c0_g1~~TRINITY_DN6263_c0_g1_i3.p5  ORF type:complete len:103 (+),score=21.98 TRINITY_DN6263_c0_g1_i3:134-442(+)